MLSGSITDDVFVSGMLFADLEKKLKGREHLYLAGLERKRSSSTGFMENHSRVGEKRVSTVLLVTDN